ncbi:MAG: hypothetical protein HYZ42_18480 [Bacteroidetes bacterium]|nr:hypothetical protein [Bacteroidota bacterium]
MKTKHIFYLLVAFILFKNSNAQERTPIYNSLDLFYKGYDLFDKGKYAESIEKYSKVNKSDSLYLDILTEKSNSLYMNEDYRETINTCKEGLERGSVYNYTFFTNMARSFDKLKIYDSAIWALENLEKIYTNNYLIKYEKARIFLSMKDGGKAADLLSDVIKTNPMYARPHYDLAKICLKTGRMTQGLMCVALYLSLDNDSKRALELISYTEKALAGDFSEDSALAKFTMKNDVDYSEIDELIESKVATNSGYKSKLKNINYPFIKQMQLISEKIAKKSSNSQSVWHVLYQKLFAEIYNDNIFEGMGFLILAGTNSENVRAGIAQNAGKIGSYKSLATKTFRDFTKDKNYESYGTADYYYYESGELQAWGKVSGEKLNGFWIFFHTNGNPSKMGNYVNGKEEGEWKFFYVNGVLKESTTYEKGKFSGPCKLFYFNGNPKFEFTYLKGKIDGEFKYYNKAGVLINSKVFVKDKLTGPYAEYNDDGIKMTEYNLVKDNIEGDYKVYYKNGQLKEQANYIKGKPEGKVTGYYDNGKVRYEGVCKKGLRIGDWIYYTKEGKTLTKEEYLKGQLNNIAIENNIDGTISRKFNYIKGKYDWVEYYWNEKLWLKYEYINGALNTLTSYDAKGKENSINKLSGKDLAFDIKYPNGNIYIKGQFENDNLQGKWTYYYQNGGIKEEIMYDKSLKNGTNTTYFKNNKPYEVIEYKDGDIDGYYTKYYKNGVISAEGWYEKGYKEGQWYVYNENGDIDYAYFMNKGVQIGFEEHYDCTGKISKNFMYDEGLVTEAQSFDTTGKIVYTSLLKNYSGTLETRTPWNNLQRTTEYKKGRAEGKTIYYNNEGKVVIDGNYKLDENNGDWLYYSNTGQLEKHYQYDDGNKTGTWYEYFDGKIADISHYTEDEEDSISTSYYPNGKVKMIINMKFGNRNGQTLNYNSEGQLYLIRYYDEGYLLGYSYEGKDGKPVEMIPITNETAKITTYFSNGNKASEFELVQGMFQGKRTVYFMNQKVFSESMFVDDDYNGEIKTYYPNGQVKTLNIYRSDEMDGEQKNYYENGKLESIQVYSYGVKTGWWKYYDNKGKEVKVEYYYNGIKIK